MWTHGHEAVPWIVHNSYNTTREQKYGTGEASLLRWLGYLDYSSHIYIVNLHACPVEIAGCSYEDRQKIGASHHREVLLSPHDGLPHQQACVRRGSHHPLQAYAQQDCWVRDALDEANPEGPCARNFAQAAGGGAGEAHGLRAGGRGVPIVELFTRVSAFPQIE